MCSYSIKTQQATAKCAVIKRQLAPTVLNKEWECESKCLHLMINLAGSCNSTVRIRYCEYLILKLYWSPSQRHLTVLVCQRWWFTGASYATVKMLFLEGRPLFWASLLANRRETYTDKYVRCCRPDRRMNSTHCGWLLFYYGIYLKNR